MMRAYNNTAKGQQLNDPFKGYSRVVAAFADGWMADRIAKDTVN